MSFTNETQNYHLPQWVGSDKPTWLVDLNGAFSAIDTGMAATQAQSDATDLVVAGHTSAISGLQSTTSDQGSAITGLRTDVDHNTGDISTINSLIGNGEPTTTDKTIIGAINELDSDIAAMAAPKKRKYVFIGDSYTDPDHADSTRWDYYIASYLNLAAADHSTIADSGAGFVTVGNKGSNLVQMVTAATADSNVTDVFVIAGVNDLNQTDSDVRDGVDDFVAAVKTKFPNAKILFSFMQKNYGATATKLISFRDLINTQFIKNGASVDPIGHGYLFEKTWIANDGVHLTNAGVEAVGKRAAALLSGSDIETVTIFNNSPAITDSGVGTISSAFIRKVYTRGIVKVFINVASSSGAITLVDNGTLNVCTFTEFVDRINEIGSLRHLANVKFAGSSDHIFGAFQIDSTGKLTFVNYSGTDVTNATGIQTIMNGGSLHYDVPGEYL